MDANADGSIRNSVILTTFFAAAGLLIAIASYIFGSKWICCPGEPKSLLAVLGKLACTKKIKKRARKVKCCKKKSNKEFEETDSSDNDDKDSERSNEPPLIDSSSLNIIVLFFYITSKVVLIIANVIYFCVAKFEDDPSLSDGKRAGMFLSFYLTIAGFAHEIGWLFP